MEQVRGLALLNVVVIGTLWGLNWPAVKFMLTELPPLTIRAVAFTVAALCLATVARARGQSLRPAPGEGFPIVLTGLLVVFGFNVLITFAQLLSEASKAAIVAYTMPALTAGLAAVFLGERLSRQGVLALAIGMGGLFVLASEDFEAFTAEPAGPLLMILAALSWALGNVALKARQWSLSALPLTVWFFVVSAALCWPLAVLFEDPFLLALPSWPVILTWIYHALGPMVICYALWTGLVDRLPASIAAITTLLAPVVGVLSAAVLLGEILTWQKTAALAMILLSIFLVIAPRRAGS